MKTMQMHSMARLQRGWQTRSIARGRFLKRYRIAVLATTDPATSTLEHHRAIRDSGWKGRVIPTFRPDAVVDPEHSDFAGSLKLLAEQTNEDVMRWDGYLNAFAQTALVLQGARRHCYRSRTSQPHRRRT